jgi:hypothetical protein
MTKKQLTNLVGEDNLGLAPNRNSSGFALPLVLLLGAFFIASAVALMSYTAGNIRQAKQQEVATSALSATEAGINYYLWHLSHDQEDYKDGTGQPNNPPYGPYVHDYKDSQGNVIGKFTLYITPPALGSNIVTVESTGELNNQPKKRKVVAQLGIPSFARYAVIANDTTYSIRFGPDTEVFGPVHNNGGVRFDGIAHDIVTSAVSTYDDPDHEETGPERVEFGVHTHRDLPPPDPNMNVNDNFRPAEAPPSTVQSRTDVFKGGRQFPVPTVDFNAITTNLSDLRSKAKIPGEGFYKGSSGSYGWRIVLKDTDKFDLYKVTGITGKCYGSTLTGSGNIDTFDITSEQQDSLNNNFPSNGIIFLEDRVWVEGQINTATLTIVAAKIGATSSEEKSIIINKDVEYTNYDGQDKLGLIAQKDILVGLYSEGSFSGTDDEKELRIDGALLAQKGRVGRNGYKDDAPWGYTDCDSSYWQRNKITTNGSIGTAQRYGFRWTSGSGYQIRTLNFDQNLTLSPPPSFPTTGVFSILSWKEKN